MKKDPYEVLGVPKTATEAEIKSAYRKLARKHHPDVDKTPDAGAKFKEVSEAYQILSDPNKKNNYDQFGHGGGPFGGAGASGGSGFNPFGGGYQTYSWSSGAGGNPSDFQDPFDLFSQIFGGGFGEAFSQGFRRRQSFQLDLTFEEAIHGVTKQIEIERQEGNQGQQRVRQQLKIKVPAGVDNGTKMRFGDIDIVFAVRRHPHFHREGADIFTEEVLTIPQIVLGDVVEVKTVEGKVKLKIPAGTEPGALIRIKDKGILSLRGKYGDHFVRVKLSVPKKLTSEEKKLYEQLGKLKDKKGWF